MIASITLTGFMAHARTEIPLCEGVTVLTGPNNTGKSAVVEALRCVAHNPPPRHFIRHGAKSASVELAFDDGVTVTWVRKPASAIYRLSRGDGSEPATFAKMGQGKVPEEIEAIVRLSKVALDEDISKNPVDVHIGNQREPVFLINQAGTVLAAFMAGATEAAYLVLMQKRLTDRLRKAQAEAKGLRAEQARHMARLDGLAPLPGLGMRLLELADALELARRELDALDEAESRLATAKLLRAQLEGARRRAAVLDALNLPPVHEPTATLSALLGSLRQAKADLSRGTGRRQALAILSAPPLLTPVSELARLLSALAAREREKARLTRTHGVLARLEAPRELAPVAGLKALCQGLTAWGARLARSAARLDGLSGLRALPDISPTAPVKAMAGRMTAARRTLDLAERRHAALGALAPLPELADTARLTSLLAALKAAGDGLASAESALARARAAEDASLVRVEARLAEVGSCPLCSARLDLEGFLKRKTDEARP